LIDWIRISAIVKSVSHLSGHLAVIDNLPGISLTLLRTCRYITLSERSKLHGFVG